ncbi:lipase family protein [Nocardia sp. CA-128927]|uniref:lipase family protein n=1 Tax=Nocardia sp. CA-128927 TaxID=3239975 RepID=UPI003D960F2E
MENVCSYSRTRRKLSGRVVAGAVTALAIVASGMLPAAADPPTPPGAVTFVADGDPWYDDPPNLAALNNGDVIRTRVVQSRWAVIPVPIQTTQILFRSTDSHGNPIATATSVLISGVPAAGARPVISYQAIIDGLAPQCNPSQELQLGTLNEMYIMSPLLAAGMALVVTDFNGKYSAVDAPSEGRMVLDGIRATQRAGLGLENSPVALYGYSGGGNASLSAAEQHRDYAPELAIRGVAAGGVPGDKVALAPYAASPAGGLYSGWLWVGLLGLAREYPQVWAGLDRHLTPEGKQTAALLSGTCTYSSNDIVLRHPIGASLIDPGAAFADPDIRDPLNEASFGRPGNTPDVPLFLWHAMSDQVVPADIGMDPVVRNYCATGGNVRYYRVAALEHFTLTALGTVGAVPWLIGLVNGADPGPTNC